MAERSVVVRWVRDVLIAGTAVLSVASLTVATTVEGANTSGTGDCKTDYCAAVPDELRTTATSVVLDAADLQLLSQQLAGSDVTVGANDAITLTAGGDLLLDSEGGVAKLLGTTEAALVAMNGTSATIAGDTINLQASTGYPANAGYPTITIGPTADPCTVTASDDGGTRLLLNCPNGNIGVGGAWDGSAASFGTDAAALPVTTTTYTSVAHDAMGYVPNTLRSVYIGTAPPNTSETTVTTISAGTAPWATSNTLRVLVWGVAAANANSKTVRLRINGAAGTVVGSCNFNNAGDTSWVAEWHVMRSGANAQSAVVECRGGVTRTVATATATESDAATITPYVTLQNATAASDATVRGLIANWIPGN